LTKRQRTLQVTEWLRQRFPTPLPVYIVFREPTNGPWWDQSEAETKRFGRRLRITLDPRCTIYYLLHALLHEWAHAVDWRHGDIERLQDRGEAPMHSDTWGVTYGRIYRAFFDEQGCQESKDFAAPNRARRQ